MLLSNFFSGKPATDASLISDTNATKAKIMMMGTKEVDIVRI